MKNDCEYTRKSLRKYLRGHLFKPEQMKIERHLKKCAFCVTEYQALKRSAETQRFLKDITPPGGVVQRVKDGVSGLTMLKKILYRPLWVAGVAGCAALLYFYVFIPLQHEREFEAGQLTASSAPAPAPAQPLLTPPAAAHTGTSAEPKKSEQTATSVPQRVEPLVVTVTVENERAAMRSINGVMRGHAVLRNMRFTDTVKEISGSLTAKELLTFFARIESAGKIIYSSARLGSYPAGEPVPFVIRLKAAPKAVNVPSAQPAPQSPEQPVQSPAPQPPTAPAS